MKVKIFSDYTEAKLETKLSEFIDGKDVVDIKFVANADKPLSALVMYKEDEGSNGNEIKPLYYVIEAPK